ncbi:zinc finger protein 501 isoform X2 [Anabrus simplex]
MAEELTFIKCEPEWVQDACGTDSLVPSNSTSSGAYPDVKDEPHTEDFSHDMMEETVKSEPDWNDPVCEDIKNEITIEDDVLNIWKDHSYIAEDSPDSGERDPDEDGVVNFEHGKDILCKLCNETFTEQCSLVKHMLQHSEIKTYACELCPQVFKEQAYLTEHVSIHTKDSFACGLCNQIFANSAQLDAHTAVHIGKRCYICSECNKSFIGEPSLQSVCAGENKYSCPGCKEKCAEISSPDLPPVGNNSEKSYSCLYCMKSFAFRSSLRYHMTVHRKKQPHDCSQCERNFQRKSALINHLKRRHLLQERDPLQ